MFTQIVTRALSRLGLDQRGTDPHPRQPAPMLRQRADAMFSSFDCIYEPKWDGFRILATVRDGHVRLVSRNGHSLTNLFGPCEVRALREEDYDPPFLHIRQKVRRKRGM